MGGGGRRKVTLQENKLEGQLPPVCEKLGIKVDQRYEHCSRLKLAMWPEILVTKVIAYSGNRVSVATFVWVSLLHCLQFLFYFA